ncbi:hypothetical protein PENTCL1PPCAC_2219, partial [Pristionchus entomophagus]
RLVVALSRSRLGLFVLGRASVFENCFELTPAFDQLSRRPKKLLIIPSESYPTQRKVEEKPSDKVLRIDDTAHMCNFVHEFYNSNVEMLTANYQAAMEEHERVRMRFLPPPEEQPMEVDEDVKKAEEKKVKEEKKKEEQAEDIAFEEMDFQRLENIPKV